MASKRFEINWIYAAFVIVIASGGLGFIGWMFTAQMCPGIKQEHSDGLDWLIVIAIDLACILCFMALLWKIYCDYYTEVTSEAITRPSLLHLRKIKWVEVKEVKVFNGVGLHIHGLNERIIVSPYAYKKPDFVVEELEKLLNTAQKGKTGV